MFRTTSLLVLALFTISAHALTPAEARAIAIGETDDRIAALTQAVSHADDRTAAYLQALADEAVKVSADKVLVVRDGKGIDPVTGAQAAVPADAEDVISNNRMRGELDTALAALKLFARERQQRMAAVTELQKDPDESRLPLIEKAHAAETDAAIKEQLALVRAAVLLTSSDPGKRLRAARLLADSRTTATRSLLLQRVKEEQDPRCKAPCRPRCARCRPRSPGASAPPPCSPA